MKNRIQLFAIVLVIVLITLACGSTTTGEKVGESNPAATSAPVTVQTYKVGDVVKVEDYTLTLNTADVTGSKLVANFTFDNTGGSKEQIVSSIISFSAKDLDGTKLEFSFCDGSGLDGKVLAGDKLRGDLCWDGVKPDLGLKIYYEVMLSSGAVVWQVR